MHRSSYIKLILILICVLSCFRINAQNGGSAIDSLLHQLQSESLSSNESIQVRIQLCKEYAESSPEIGIEYIEQAFRMLDKSPNDSLYIHSLLAKSTAYSYLAAYDSSTLLSLQALEMAELRQDTIGLLDAYNNLGIDFMYTEDYENSYKYLTELIRVGQLANDSLRLGHGLNNLGLVEYYLGNEEKELERYNKAKIIFEKIGEQEGLGNTILNIGTIYTVNGEYQLAQKYYSEALNIFEQLGYQSAYANVLQSMSEDFMEQGDFSKASQMANDALGILKQNELKQDVAYVYDLMQKIQVAKGNYQKAHEYLVLYHKINDEIFDEEKSGQIKELQTKYETTKKEAEIGRLELDNQLQDLQLSTARNQLIGTGIIALLIIGGGIAFGILRNNSIKADRIAQEHQMDALRQRLLEMQMQSSAMEMTYDLVDLNTKLHTPLTEREHDTLTLSLTGKSNKEIADELFVSVNTIKFHLRNIYQKLGVSNKKEVLEYVVKST